MTSFFFRSPVLLPIGPTDLPTFSFSLSTILEITTPLGIPWHPLTCKGHDFQTWFSYVGFEWDLTACTMSLSDEKFLHLLDKLSKFLADPPPCVNMKIIASIHGSLQHVSCIHQHGHHYLPAISNFLSKFPNEYTMHHIPKP